IQAEDGIRDRNVTGVQTCALPISSFSSYWQIDSKNITSITYDSNDALKLLQLLGLRKKDKQIINLSEIKNASVVYRKNLRLSPVDFNPDYRDLILDLNKGTKVTLSLGSIDYQKLDSILTLLEDKDTAVHDKQGVQQLLKENKNLFNHFHRKEWTSL